VFVGLLFWNLISDSISMGAVSMTSNSSLLKKVNANPQDITITNEFLKWNKAGGKVLNGLTKRRTIEAKIYFTI
jgi:lysozyme